MKDPSSAQFRNFGAAKASDGTIHICGETNARNSFGGYVGFTAFYGNIRPNRGRFDLLLMEGSRVSRGNVIETCRRAGAWPQ